MGMADDIAANVKGGGAEESTPEPEAVLKEGDAGKRALAAIASKDAIALEQAIRDCLSTESY